MPQQNENILLSKRAYFYDLCISDNKIYFPDYYTGILFEVDCSKNGKIIGRRDTYFGNFKEHLYSGIYKNTNWFVLSEIYEKKIVIINTKEKLYMKVSTEKWFCDYASFQNGDVFFYDNKIYIFVEEGGILRLDINCLSIESIYYPPDLDKRGEVIEKDGKIFIPCLNKNLIFQFDLRTEIFSKILLDKTISGIETLCIQGNNYWITNQSDKIIYWNIKEDKYKFFSYPYDVENMIYRRNVTKEMSNKKFSKSFLLNDFIYLIPEYSPHVLYIDLNCYKVRIFNVDGEEENEETLYREKRKNLVKYVASCIDSNNLYLLSSKTEILYKINMITRDISKLNLCINDTQRVIEMAFYENVSFNHTFESGKKYLL